MLETLSTKVNKFKLINNTISHPNLKCKRVMKNICEIQGATHLREGRDTISILLSRPVHSFPEIVQYYLRCDDQVRNPFGGVRRFITCLHCISNHSNFNILSFTFAQLYFVVQAVRHQLCCLSLYIFI